MSLVLIDTSAWIAFLHGERAAITRIDPLLANGDAAVCGPTFAELVSGAPSPVEMRRLETLLHGLEWIEPAARVWERVAAARYALARSGVQAAIVDLLIAISAADGDAALLTRDRDFERIADVVPVRVLRF